MPTNGFTVFAPTWPSVAHLSGRFQRFKLVNHTAVLKAVRTQFSWRLGLTAVSGHLIFQEPTKLFPRLSPVPGACNKETL